ncbi:MAG: hypothetical protein WD011_03730 [Nitriliruptoraceae bacterium]
MHHRWLIGALVGISTLLPVQAAIASNHTAQVVVVHGVPGLTVDVLVDGLLRSRTSPSPTIRL